MGDNLERLRRPRRRPLAAMDAQGIDVGPRSPRSWPRCRATPTGERFTSANARALFRLRTPSRRGPPRSRSRAAAPGLEETRSSSAPGRTPSGSCSPSPWAAPPASCPARPPRGRCTTDVLGRVQPFRAQGPDRRSAPPQLSRRSARDRTATTSSPSASNVCSWTGIASKGVSVTVHRARAGALTSRSSSGPAPRCRPPRSRRRDHGSGPPPTG